MTPAADDQSTSTPAKILYRPVGLISSVAGGLIANALFTQVWRRAAPGARTDPPDALDSGHRLPEILAAAALQGVIYSVTKTVIDRAGARGFQRWSGEWPGP